MHHFKLSTGKELDLTVAELRELTAVDATDHMGIKHHRGSGYSVAVTTPVTEVHTTPEDHATGLLQVTWREDTIKRLIPKLQDALDRIATLRIAERSGATVLGMRPVEQKD